MYEYSFNCSVDTSYSSSRRNDYTRVIDHLKDSNYFWNIKFDSIIYSVIMGSIHHLSDEGIKILLTLAIKSDYVYTIDKDNPQMENFVLLLDQSFLEDEKYKRFYKRVNSEYIVEASNMGISILITRNIEPWCYKPIPNSTLRFDSIPEMKQFLLQFNSLAYGQQLQLGR